MSDGRMQRSFRVAAALALGVGLAAAALPGTAQAQFFGGWGGWDDGGTWDGLAPQQVRRAIASRGFRVLAPLRRNGSVFVADVLDRRGRHERLIVAAADAEILQRFLIDDGRRPGAFPREGDVATRGDDPDGLVPPADVPNVGPRPEPPRDRTPPRPRLGDLGTQGDDDGGDDRIAPPTPQRRAQPPIRTVRPPSRVVDRAPDTAAPARQPTAVQATPLAPPAPRDPAVLPVVKAPAPPAAVASAPEPAPAPALQPRRQDDPLAAPGAREGRPVRSVATGITGTPTAAAAPAPAAPARPADVPVAPLD